MQKMETGKNKLLATKTLKRSNILTTAINARPPNKKFKPMSSFQNHPTDARQFLIGCTINGNIQRLTNK